MSVIDRLCGATFPLLQLSPRVNAVKQQSGSFDPVGLATIAAALCLQEELCMGDVFCGSGSVTVAAATVGWVVSCWLLSSCCAMVSCHRGCARSSDIIQYDIVFRAGLLSAIFCVVWSFL